MDTRAFVRGPYDLPESELRASSASEQIVRSRGRMIGTTGSNKPVADFCFWNPVPRDHNRIRVNLFVHRHVVGVASRKRAFISVFKCREAMVVLVEQLGFVKWKVAFVFFDEYIALQTPAALFQLLPSSEQAGVVGHVEHGGESDAPPV